MASSSFPCVASQNEASVPDLDEKEGFALSAGVFTSSALYEDFQGFGAIYLVAICVRSCERICSLEHGVHARGGGGGNGCRFQMF